MGDHTHLHTEDLLPRLMPFTDSRIRISSKGAALGRGDGESLTSRRGSDPRHHSAEHTDDPSSHNMATMNPYAYISCAHVFLGIIGVAIVYAFLMTSTPNVGAMATSPVVDFMADSRSTGVVALIASISVSIVLAVDCLSDIIRRQSWKQSSSTTRRTSTTVYNWIRHCFSDLSHRITEEQIVQSLIIGALLIPSLIVVDNYDDNVRIVAALSGAIAARNIIYFSLCGYCFANIFWKGLGYHLCSIFLAIVVFFGQILVVVGSTHDPPTAADIICVQLGTTVYLFGFIIMVIYAAYYFAREIGKYWNPFGGNLIQKRPCITADKMALFGHSVCILLWLIIVNAKLFYIQADHPVLFSRSLIELTHDFYGLHWYLSIVLSIACHVISNIFARKRAEDEDDNALAGRSSNNNKPISSSSEADDVLKIFQVPLKAIKENLEVLFKEPHVLDSVSSKGQQSLYNIAAACNRAILMLEDYSLFKKSTTPSQMTLQKQNSNQQQHADDQQTHSPPADQDITGAGVTAKNDTIIPREEQLGLNLSGLIAFAGGITKAAKKNNKENLPESLEALTARGTTEERRSSPVAPEHDHHPAYYSVRNHGRSGPSLLPSRGGCEEEKRIRIERYNAEVLSEDGKSGGFDSGGTPRQEDGSDNPQAGRSAALLARLRRGLVGPGSGGSYEEVVSAGEEDKKAAGESAVLFQHNRSTSSIRKKQQHPLLLSGSSSSTASRTAPYNNNNKNNSGVGSIVLAPLAVGAEEEDIETDILSRNHSPAVIAIPASSKNSSLIGGTTVRNSPTVAVVSSSHPPAILIRRPLLEGMFLTTTNKNIDVVGLGVQQVNSPIVSMTHKKDGTSVPPLPLDIGGKVFNPEDTAFQRVLMRKRPHRRLSNRSSKDEGEEEEEEDDSVLLDHVVLTEGGANIRRLPGSQPPLRRGGGPAAERTTKTTTESTTAFTAPRSILGGFGNSPARRSTSNRGPTPVVGGGVLVLKPLHPATLLPPSTSFSDMSISDLTLSTIRSKRYSVASSVRSRYSLQKGGGYMLPHNEEEDDDDDFGKNHNYYDDDEESRSYTSYGEEHQVQVQLRSPVAAAAGGRGGGGGGRNHRSPSAGGGGVPSREGGVLSRPRASGTICSLFLDGSYTSYGGSAAALVELTKDNLNNTTPSLSAAAAPVVVVKMPPHNTTSPPGVSQMPSDLRYISSSVVSCDEESYASYAVSAAVMIVPRPPVLAGASSTTSSNREQNNHHNHHQQHAEVPHHHQQQQHRANPDYRHQQHLSGVSPIDPLRVISRLPDCLGTNVMLTEPISINLRNIDILNVIEPTPHQQSTTTARAGATTAAAGAAHSSGAHRRGNRLPLLAEELVNRMSTNERTAYTRTVLASTVGAFKSIAISGNPGNACFELLSQEPPQQSLSSSSSSSIPHPMADGSSTTSHLNCSSSSSNLEHQEFCWRLLGRLRCDLSAAADTYELLLSSLDNSFMVHGRLHELQGYIHVVQQLVAKAHNSTNFMVDYLVLVQRTAGNTHSYYPMSGTTTLQASSTRDEDNKLDRSKSVASVDSLASCRPRRSSGRSVYMS